MKIITSLHCIILILFCLPGLTQAEEVAPFTLNAHYEFDWNGVNLGRVVIAAEETPTTYKLQSFVKSKGMVSLFAKHHSETLVEGKRAGNRYFATLYETRFQTRKKPKHIKIVFDGAGKITEELSEPVDSDRPKVPQVEKDAAFDLLTTVMMIRERLHEALAQGKKNYAFDMYDGRRLSHLSFNIIGKETYRSGKDKRAVIHVVASRKPGPGYTDKELDRMKNEPSMDIYLSDDNLLLPLAMGVSYMGTIRGQLVEQCAKLEDCFR